MRKTLGTTYIERTIHNSQNSVQIFTQSKTEAMITAVLADNKYLYCHDTKFNEHFQVPWGMEGRAYRTVPPELEITFSTIPGAGLGIMSKAFIPKHTWLGEYDGTTVRPEMRDFISWYTWAVSYAGTLPIIIKTLGY